MSDSKERVMTDEQILACFAQTVGENKTDYLLRVGRAIETQARAQQQAAPEGEQEFQALGAMLSWSAEDWNELLTRYPQQREILQKLLGQQQAASAPVAFLYQTQQGPAVQFNRLDYFYSDSAGNYIKGVPLYAAPQPTVPADVMADAELTDDMIVAGMEASVAGRPSVDDDAYVRSIWNAMCGARAAEKGTT